MLYSNVKAWSSAQSVGLCKFISCVALAATSATAQAPGDIRVALVIGNSAYPGKSALSNPGNDARAMTASLKALGFSVVEVQDASQQQMVQAIAKVGESLKGKQGVGMLYYAGHGLQYDWRNFMVPVDAKLNAQTDIPVQTVDIASVLDTFKSAGNRINILVLDACRDNPFDNQLATKGLAPVDAPPNTFVAFATAAGNVAEDGDGNGDAKSANGLYTRFLVQELQKPFARVEDVFTRVKYQVRQKSAGRQVPSDSSNLDEAFSFDKGFAKLTQENSNERLDRYNAEKAAWNLIKDSRDANDFFAFLQRYPSGFVSEIAQFRADQLQRPLISAQKGRNEIATLSSGLNRFALGDEYTVTTIDLLTQAQRRETQKVTMANDQRVEVNNGETVYDQMGSLLKDDTGQKDPPVLLVPADISLGKRWKAGFKNRVRGFNIDVSLDFKTVALEDLQIAGAKIKTYKVEIDGFGFLMGGSGKFTGNLWIEPTTMRLVRYDRTLRVRGALFESSSLTVTDYKPAPR